MIVSKGYAPAEMMVHAYWFGWLNGLRSYAYQTRKDGPYFLVDL